MQIGENIEWLRLYYVRGNYQGRSGRRFNYEVKDPPCLGWQYAVVLRGEKRSTIFCPYSFDAWTVRNDCAELEGAIDMEDFRPDWFEGHMQSRWKEYQSLGFMKDYDTAALVLRRLGLPVPEQVMKGGEEDTRKRGGKPAADELKKNVVRDSKRGRFLSTLIHNDGGSIRGLMAEFSMTRSNALSYLFVLWKDHGIGYELIGDQVQVQVPGNGSPFDDTADEDWLG